MFSRNRWGARIATFTALAVVMLVTTAGGAWGAPLYEENFNYTGLLTDNGWSAHSGAGSNSFSAAAPGLTYTGYASSGIGNATSFVASGEDVNHPFTQQTLGSVYAAAIVQFTSTTSGDYFMHMGPSTIGSTYNGRLFAKTSGSGFQLGIAKWTEAATYGTTVYSLNTPYLIVLKYTFVAGGTTNDVFELFVNPTPGAAEPAATISVASATTDASNLGSFALRQGSSTPKLKVDGIRVATTWADAVAAAAVNYTLTTAVSPASSGTVTLNPAGGSYASGTNVTMTANAAAHYHFVNWTGSVTGSVSPTTVTMDANKSVTANFALDQFALTVLASPTAGGTVTGGGTFDYGTPAPITATANPGYTFVNWTGSGIADPNAASTTATVDVAKTVTANFTLNTYTLTTGVDPVGGGTVSGGGTYSHGATATLSATANPGFRFDFWTGAWPDTVIDNPVDLTMDGDKNAIAHFKPVYTLATVIDVVGGGTVTLDPSGGTYDEGTSVTLTAEPALHYDFVEWTGDLTGSTNPAALTMDADKSVTAHFALEQFLLTVEASPPAGGSVTGGGTYDHGTPAPITATTNPGYAFVNWTGDGIADPNSASTTVTVDAAKTVTANFAPLAVRNTDTGLYYATIQAAIDATETVAGHTIEAGAGTFTEQVVVNKALTITGTGCGTTIIASPATLTQSYLRFGYTVKPIVFVNGVDATVQNLTIDGAGQGPANRIFTGLSFYNGGGKGANLCIENITETPINTVNTGVAVTAWNSTGGPYALELDHVTATTFQKNGMALEGNGLTVNVHDCTVTGIGYTAEGLGQNGIQVARGATGAITRCAITELGFLDSPYGYTSSGVLAYDAAGTLTVSDCKGDSKFNNVQVPVLLWNSAGTVDGIEVRGQTLAAIQAATDQVSALLDRTGEQPAPRQVTAKPAPFGGGDETPASTTGTLSGYAVSVANSCFYGTDATGSIGIEAYSAGAAMDVTATNNTVQDWDYGLLVDGPPATLTAHENAILSNVTAGFDASASPTQDGERNWWGDAGGPGVGGANVALGVDYDVWIHSGTNLTTCAFDPPTYSIAASVTGTGGSIAPAGTTTAYEGDDVAYTITPDPGYAVADVLVDGSSVGPVATYTFTNVTDGHTIAASFVQMLVQNTDTGLYYATIQAAIDATETVAGHTIAVGAGTFEEQVEVNKALTITGAGCGTTVIRSPALLTASFTTPGPNVNKPVVFVNGVDATIQNLTIDGGGLGNSNYRFVGLAFWNGGGKGADLCIEHIEDTPFSGAQHGVGVYAFNETGGPYAIELDHVTVTDFQKTGIALLGTGLTVNVHDCTATGKGYTGVTAQNGIQLSAGATGAITACKVSDIGYTGSGWAASGLLVQDAAGSVAVSDMKGANRIENVQAPINWYTSDGTVDGVEIANSAKAEWECGIYAYNYNASLAAGTRGTAASRTPPAKASPFDESLVANSTTGTLATSYTLSVTNSCVFGTDATNTVGLGVYSDGGGMTLDVANTTVQDWEYGIVHYGGPATLAARENSITSNNTAGLWGDGTSEATRNWWGDASGPSGAGSGTGDAAYDAVFTPWIHSGTDLASGCEFDPPTYSIVATAGANGGISPPGTTIAYEGDDIAYSITPDGGYTVADVLVDGSSVGPVNTYTFTNVIAGHSIAASFTLAGNNVVAAMGDTLCITPVTPCLTIPVNITRTSPTDMRLFHVDFTLSPALKLCGTTGNSVLEGEYLNSMNPNTTFFVLDNGGGSYTADGTINGLPCGQDAASGTLFYIKVASNGGTGTGTITVDNVVLRDCVNNDITPAAPGAPAVIYFDATPVAIGEIADQTVAELASLTVTPVGTITECADGPLTWSIDPAVPAGATFNSTDGVITWTPDCSQAGTYGPYTLTATAASGETDTEEFSILVTDTPGGVAVTVTPDPQVVEELSPLTVTPALDLTGCAAGRTPVWSADSLPGGATFDTGTGVVTWTPACGQAGTYGPYTLTATVTAVGGQTYSGSATFSILVSHLVGTVAIAEVVDQTVEELSTLTITPSATKTDCAGTLTWSIDPALPSGAAFDTGTGAISWTPPCGAAAGTYGPYTLTATAATGEVGTEDFGLTVTHKVGTVAIDAIADQTVEELGTLTVTPHAALTDCAAGPVTWGIAPALPSGATFDTGSGQIVWTPPCGAAGPYGPYTLTATSATGEVDTEGFGLTVTHKVGTITVATIADPQTVVEQSTLTVTPVPTVTPCVGTLTWSVTTGTLPAGAGFDPVTGTITWTPGYGTAGPYGPFVLTATASTGEVGASNSFTIVVTHLEGTVAVDPIPTPQTVEETATLVITPSATVSPSVGPLTWSADSLPGGAILDPVTGQVTWTPACGQVGTYGPFVLTATASTGESGSSNPFTIVVTHKVGTVTVAAIATPQTVNEMATLTVTPSASLTDCAAGPLTWSVTTGTLPAWATFTPGTGVIVFAPGCTDAGSYGPFALTATSATGEVGSSNEFSLTVTDVPVAIDPPTTATAEQVRLGNAPGDTTGIKIYFTQPTGAVSYKVYRAPYGHHPEYDDAGGTVPVAPTVYPPSAPWVETAVTTEGGTDTPAERDFWYYVVYAVNGCGDVSGPSNMTGGTLNYHLGDVSNGYTLGQGDNLVGDVDISGLGAHYGITLLHVGDPYNFLDVGPTTTHYVDGRPLTDDKVNFEDLVMFAINYGTVTVSGMTTALPPVAATGLVPAATDALVLLSPDEVAVGDLLTVPLRMQGTGLVQALSVRLAWDATVVEPVGQAAGELLLRLNGVALSPEPGTVDVAVLGEGRAVVGEGVLATVTFRVLVKGDPQIRLETVDARDTRNATVALNATREALGPTLPTVTTLSFAVPNPFRSEVTLAFSLAQPGPVSLRIYSVDGRLVRTLVSGTQEAGWYRPVWDGRDDHGNAMSAGVFYARLVAGRVNMTRTMSYLR